MGMLALSVGAALLLAAVFIVVGSSQSWFAERLSNIVSPNTIPTNTSRITPFTRTDSAHDSMAGEASAQDTAFGIGAPNSNGAFARSDGPGGNSLQSRGKISAASPTTSERNSPDHMRRVDSSAPSRAPATVPWSATKCVVAIQPDPAEPTRWWLENECDTAVAILFSARRDTSWTYLSRPMLLPAKSQRFTPHAEETQYGEEIRYVACVPVTESLIREIIVGRGSGSESKWLGDIDAAGSTDECFARVASSAELGRRSGRSIEQMIGPNAPGRMRVAR